ncbi:MAG: 50S ribosomal protein L6 [Porphyromonas sp.]|nr:50S ribosomal protein L6 [Porphyromonas sp.]
MSRIGKMPIHIPNGVSVTIKDNVISAKGPKGEMSQAIDARLKATLEDGELKIENFGETKEENALHGLYRSLVNNMVIGVSEGYTKTLELVGVGFRASNQGQLLELSLGYSHPIYLMLPDEITVETKMERNKAPLVTLSSPDKQLLGQVCAKIRTFRKIEPYKGKGIKFVGEYIRRKSGKSAAK